MKDRHKSLLAASVMLLFIASLLGMFLYAVAKEARTNTAADKAAQAGSQYKPDDIVVFVGEYKCRVISVARQGILIKNLQTGTLFYAKEKELRIYEWNTHTPELRPE